MSSDMSKKDEIQKLVFAARTGNPKAKSDLLRALAQSIESQVTKYSPYADPDDLRQAASIGVLKALEKYDPVKSDNFAPYALEWIRAEINDEIGRTGTLPRGTAARVRRVRRKAASIETQAGEAPDTATLAEAANVSEAFAEFALHPPWFMGDSDPPSREDVKRFSAIVEWIIATHDTPERDAIQAERVDQLGAALLQLTDSEQKILALQYGLNGSRPHKLHEIATLLGLSLPSVKKSKRRALNKLAQFYGRAE